jgi:hypothetical protein
LYEKGYLNLPVVTPLGKIAVKVVKLEWSTFAKNLFMIDSERVAEGTSKPASPDSLGRGATLSIL